MLDYIRIGCAVPAVRVGDTRKNAEDICDFLRKADGQNVDLLVFPEMSLTGYTCQDLFFQDTLERRGLGWSAGNPGDLPVRLPPGDGGGWTATAAGRPDVQLRGGCGTGQDSGDCPQNRHS